jgi:tRNA(fMet)-specific endonuclease VapC
MILDTNALSAWADGAAAVRPALSSAARLVVPAVALGEYLFGILQSRHRERYERWLAGNLAGAHEEIGNKAPQATRRTLPKSAVP